MKSGVKIKFSDIIEFFFNTSGIYMEYFRRVAKSSNKYGRDHLKNGKYGGMKWININIQEMLHLYGAILWISIEPWNLGWYTS